MEDFDEMTNQYAMMFASYFVTAFMVISPVVHCPIASSNQIVSYENASPIAQEHIKHPVIPPTLSKVRKPRLVEELEKFKEQPDYHSKSQISDYEHFNEPAE